MSITPSHRSAGAIVLVSSFLVAAIAARPAAAADETVARKSLRTGDIRVHAKFHSKTLDNDRDLLVYLPPGYQRDTDRRYPVFYMHDGQNVFDEATSTSGIEWNADETAERLIREGTIEPLIIVAISATPARLDEYTLYRDARRGAGAAGGAGKSYMKFVVEEVKPFIDSTYRTKPDRQNTGVGGASLGATISLELCRAYPDVVGRCAAMPPALGWANYELLKRLDTDSKWIRDCRFWIDVGTLEGQGDAQHNSYLGGLLRLEAKLLFAGLKKGEGYEVLIVDGGEHSEAAWSTRFDKMLTFLFPPHPAAYNPPHGPANSSPTPAPDPAVPDNLAAGRPAPK